VKRFGEFILSNPRLVISGLVVIAFTAIYPALNIRTDFNLEGFYPDQDIVILQYRILEEEFGRDDNTIIIGFKSDSLFSYSVLSDLYQITNRLNEIELLDDVLSIWNALDISETDGRLSFDPFLEHETLAETDFNQLRSDITRSPLLEGLLVNKEGTASAIVLVINEELNSYPNRNRIISETNEILSGFHDKYTFHISGIPYFRNQYVNMLNSEIVMYITISSALIIMLLWYLYRTIWGILFPMIIVWTTLLFTIAIMQLTGGYLEIMSSTIAPILLCVGVADAVHMIAKYDDARESGMGKRPSIIEMLKTLGNATFLTSITTAIGFASLLSSTVMPMKKFGIYTAVGVLIAYVITIFFLPSALRLSRRKKVVNTHSGAFYPYLTVLLTKIAAFNRLHYKAILVFGFVITGIFLFGIKSLDVNARVFDDIAEDTQIMRDSRFFSENIAPQFPMEFIIDTEIPEGILNLEMLHKAEILEKKLLEFPEIHRVTGIHTLLKEVHRVMAPEESASHTGLPESDEAIAQYILLLEINEADDLYRLVDFDYQKMRLSAFTEDAGSKRINEIRDEVSVIISDLFSDVNVIITGTTILSADLTEKIVYSLAWSILLALSAITLIMVLLFKSTRLILIALIPNIIPLVIVGGIMGFLNVDIKPSTAVIFTIALGIAVDDSIHYLARFRIEYLQRKAMMPAVTATTIRTGRAIIVTSIILIAGFGTLITSAFTSTAMMGILVCSTIISALFADLFILPALFYWLKPKLDIVEDPR
jgi:uncharacterized protein